METEKKKIKINVNGKYYTFLHDESDEYINQLVHYLNGKITSASKGGIQLGEPTNIVAASLDITDELFKAQKNFNALKAETNRMIEEYDRMKAESHDIEEQLVAALKQVEELKRKIHWLENR